VDVPDASVGLSSGWNRQQQRITSKDSDELLRKKEGKTARLIEIISQATMEVGTSRRRPPKKQEKQPRCFQGLTFGMEAQGEIFATIR